MGKMALIIVFGSLVTGAMMFTQSKQAHMASTERQADYQEEVLATTIARSALDMAMAQVIQAGTNYDAAVGSINGFLDTGEPNPAGKMSGTMRDGSYEVTAHTINGQVFMVKAKGRHNGKEVEFKKYHRIPMLVAQDWSQLSFEVLKGASGFCHSFYVQRTIPIEYMPEEGSPTDSTSSYPRYGQVSDDGKWFVGEPEMLLPMDKHYELIGNPYVVNDIVLPPGSLINFVMGVSKRFHPRHRCPNRGTMYERFDASRYGFVNYALGVNSEDPEQMQEGDYAMIEQHNTKENTWRIAMEDWATKHKNPEEPRDIKANGYPATGRSAKWDNENNTFGGTGWTGKQDSRGYRQLSNAGAYPDFYDLMVEVNWVTCDGAC